MPISKTPIAGGFFSDRDFINTKTSLILSVFDYLEGVFFPGDPSRVIYSSNQFAFRRRNQLLTEDTASHKLLTQNLNVPFVNFYLTSLSPNTDRKWKSRPLELHGIMDWTINKKLRLSPMKLSFEATIYTNKETDRHYAMSQIFWEGALETKLKPTFELDGETFSNIAVVGFDLNFSNQYTENDWLEKNNIRATSIDFNIDTYLVKTNTSGFCIPKQVLVSFASSHNIDIEKEDNYETLLNGVIDHINGNVVFE